MITESAAMLTALRALRDESPRSAYPGLSLATLDALVARGLAYPAKRGLGAFHSPRTSILYGITARGKSLLADIVVQAVTP